MKDHTLNQMSLFNSAIIEPAFWSISRHEIIASAAQDLLKDDNAVLEQIREILKPLGTDKLASIAGWADTVKRRAPNPDKDDPFTLEFLRNKENSDNDIWHYVNLPLGAEKYSREIYENFTRKDDVVQILKQAIQVLRGTSERFSPVNALRLVTHLVGDIHQPIHVGCCYINTKSSFPELVTDPDFILANGLEGDHDEGGNKLLLSLPGNTSLHSYWDSQIFNSSAFTEGEDAGFANSETVTPLTVTDENKLSKIAKIGEFVVDRVNKNSDAITASFANLAAVEVEELPEQWAANSLKEAKNSYFQLRIVDVKIIKKKTKYVVAWGYGGQGAYNQLCKPIAEKQSSLASANLAELLKRIWS